MSSASTSFYSTALVARLREMVLPGQTVIEQSGLYGLLGCDEDPRVRLLVTDDRAYDALVALRDGTRAGTVTVFEQAPRCVALMAGDRGWTSSSSTAMVCRELATVPGLALTDDLALRNVRRVADDPLDGVALDDTVAAVASADPGEDPDALAALLRSLPGNIRLFAAVDADGVVRATSGWQLAGTHVRVFLVDTDPAWRGRGIATAMTSWALHTAYEHGARHATLDASTAGKLIYLRLGFELVSEMTRFRLSD